MFSLNNLDLFVSGVDVKTQEEVALKLVSEVVMYSCHSNFSVGMAMGRVLVDTIPVCPLNVVGQNICIQTPMVATSLIVP